MSVVVSRASAPAMVKIAKQAALSAAVSINPP